MRGKFLTVCEDGIELSRSGPKMSEMILRGACDMYMPYELTGIAMTVVRVHGFWYRQPKAVASADIASLSVSARNVELACGTSPGSPLATLTSCSIPRRSFWLSV